MAARAVPLLLVGLVQAQGQPPGEVYNSLVGLLAWGVAGWGPAAGTT